MAQALSQIGIELLTYAERFPSLQGPFQHDFLNLITEASQGLIHSATNFQKRLQEFDFSSASLSQSQLNKLSGSCCGNQHIPQNSPKEF